MATRGVTAWPMAAGLPDLVIGDTVHLIGIGGAGMSGLARVLAASGLAVSGCDQQPSAALTSLARDGIAVRVGHDPAHLEPPPRLVVHSPAIEPDSPELAAALRAGVPVTRRAVLLGALMDARTGVAVAGTHGKTTTSGLISTVVTAAGLEPSFFVGGTVRDLGTNARLGSGDVMVLEADEYDHSFLHGHPALAIVTNVEHDHPDLYPDLDAVVGAFRRFVVQIRPWGKLIANAASPTVLRVLEDAQVPVELYYVDGDPTPPPRVHLAWRAHRLGVTEAGSRFGLRHHGDSLGTWIISLPGGHNVGNAVAAIAASVALDVQVETIRRALAHYRGAERRFEVVGMAAGIAIIDDYAHHPTEVAATIQAARERFPGARIWAILQPHTFSRVATLSDAFAEALGDADRVVVTPVFAARELSIPGADAARIAASVPGAQVATTLDEAGRIAAEGALAGDALLFMGAGDITTASRGALRTLRRRHARLLVEQAEQRGLGGEVLCGEPLANHTSLRVGGPADVMVRVQTLDDLAGWWRLAHELGSAVRVIGRGTNVLAGDGGFPGLILLNRCEAWQIEADPLGVTALVTAESGVTLATLGGELARRGWGGLEAGVGIPGSVGAGVVINAGAHGWSMADNIIAIEVLGPEGTVRWLDAADLGFGYRSSVLRGNAEQIVLRATLGLRRADPEVLRAEIAENTARRRATQPSSPSAGSMFRNPPGDYAGRLIEAAGLKGVTIGGAQISSVHANFFVNTAGATAADVAALIGAARESVRQRFGVQLELEIESLGQNGVD